MEFLLAHMERLLSESPWHFLHWKINKGFTDGEDNGKNLRKTSKNKDSQIQMRTKFKLFCKKNKQTNNGY